MRFRRLQFAQGRLDAIWFLAVCRGQTVEESKPPVDPGPGTHAGEKHACGKRADVFMEPSVVKLLARAKPARDKERIHRRAVGKRVV